MDLYQPKIYITDFDVKSCLKVKEQLDAIVQYYGSEQAIVLHIESPGGSTVGLFIILDALNSISNPIFTYTTGMAASAGFVLLVAGSRNGGLRVVGEDAHLMLHGVQVGFGNGYIDLKDADETIRSAKVLNEQMLNYVVKAMGLESIGDLKKIIQTMTDSHDLNLTSKEARELGMIDIVGALKFVPPEYKYNLTILDTDIDSHRKMCTDENCECRIKEKKPKKYNKGKK